MKGIEVPLEDAKGWAKEVIDNLFKFELMRSTTPEKQGVLNKVEEHRIALCEIFDIVCPDWADVGN